MQAQVLVNFDAGAAHRLVVPSTLELHQVCSRPWKEHLNKLAVFSTQWPDLHQVVA